MRFLVAAAALTTVSTPALASELSASSRAIPPLEEQNFVAPQQTVQNAISDLVFRPSEGADAAPATASIKPAIVAAETQARRPAPRAADDAQQTCIAQAVYYESKGEPLRGQRAVADVIINRTRRPGFASTPCGVIRQPHQFTNARRWRIPSAADPLWQTAREIARNAVQGIGTVSEVITHFHAVRINPGWSMRRVAAIGGHVFY